MNAVWQCTRCFALHFAGERLCRRCGAPRPGASVPTITPRAPSSVAVHLALPPTDFPYTRRARARGRQLAAPLVLLALAVTLAVGWDPVARRVAAASALGGESPEAVAARRDELRDAVSELGRALAAREATLVAAADEAPSGPEPWRADARAVGARWRLHGEARSATLGPLEVRARALWLAVASLPADAGAAGPHVSLVREELSRLSEDLSHAR